MTHELIPTGFELLAAFAGAGIFSMFAASFLKNLF